MNSNFLENDMKRQVCMGHREFDPDQSKIPNSIPQQIEPSWNSHSDIHSLNEILDVGIFNALQTVNGEDPDTQINNESSISTLLTLVTSAPSTSTCTLSQSLKNNIDITPIASHNNAGREKVKYINLNALLLSSCDGKLIKKAYADNDNLLTENARTELTRIIIKWESDRRLQALYDSDNKQITEFKINTEVFIEYAEQIVKIFPGENQETYYSKFVTVNGQRILADGKLWDRFNTVKGNLRRKGLLAPASSRKKLLELEKNSVIITENEQSQLSYLENHCEPWTQVCYFWKSTLKTRQQLLMRDNLEPYEYFKRFAGLQLQKGLELINIDFDNLYPGKSQNFVARWNIIKPHLIRKIKQSTKIKNVDDLAFVHLLETLPSENQDGLIFYLLPYVIDQQRKVTSKRTKHNDDENLNEPPNKKIRRLSMEERRSSFTMRIENSVDLADLLDERRKSLRKSKKTLQPTPVITGSHVKPEVFYIIFDNLKYQATSYLHAIDVTLKIFFITQCAFPEDSGILWLFVQRALFSIQQPTDKYNLSLSALVGEVEKIVSEKL